MESTGATRCGWGQSVVEFQGDQFDKKQVGGAWVFRGVVPACLCVHRWVQGCVHHLTTYTLPYPPVPFSHVQTTNPQALMPSVLNRQMHILVPAGQGAAHVSLTSFFHTPCTLTYGPSCLLPTPTLLGHTSTGQGAAGRLPGDTGGADGGAGPGQNFDRGVDRSTGGAAAAGGAGGGAAGVVLLVLR
jgi:hypothetical protein